MSDTPEPVAEVRLVQNTIEIAWDANEQRFAFRLNGLPVDAETLRLKVVWTAPGRDGERGAGTLEELAFDVKVRNEPWPIIGDRWP